MADTGFCEYLKKLCTHCWENNINVCTVKLGEQDYYKGFQLYDTVHITRKGGRYVVETDIEVTYRTKYPYGKQSSKAAEFIDESLEKNLRLRAVLQKRLPQGVYINPSHEHYNPDKHDPERVALHVHVSKSTDDLDDAKLIAERLVQSVNPREIEKAL